MKEQRFGNGRLKAVPAPLQGAFSPQQHLTLSIFNYHIYIPTPPPPQNLPKINAVSAGFGGLYASRKVKK
jgi:hypothetical protein